MQAEKHIRIIVPDSLVIIDGVSHQFTFAAPAGVWAVQWDVVSETGEVEYSDGRRNESIAALSTFDSILVALDDHLAAIQPSPLHVLLDGQWSLDLPGLQSIKLDEIHQAYSNACSGSVVCSVGGTDYTMNAGEEHANRMFAGYNLAKGLFDLGQGPATMIITDYNDADHADVPLADAYNIAIQQGTHFAIQRQRKNDLRRQVLAVEIPQGGDLADAQTELDGIVW